MKSAENIFIYERNEIILLLLIGATASLIAFTLGVHYGKQIGVKKISAEHESPPLVKTVPDKIPTRHEFSEQAKGNPSTMDETIREELHQEITKSKIKLETSHQVELPQNTKNKHGGATTIHSEY